MFIHQKPEGGKYWNLRKNLKEENVHTPKTEGESSSTRKLEGEECSYIRKNLKEENVHTPEQLKEENVQIPKTEGGKCSNTKNWRRRKFIY